MRRLFVACLSAGSLVAVACGSDGTPDRSADTGTDAPQAVCTWNDCDGTPVRCPPTGKYDCKLSCNRCVCEDPKTNFFTCTQLFCNPCGYDSSPD